MKLTDVIEPMDFKNMKLYKLVHEGNLYYFCSLEMLNKAIEVLNSGCYYINFNLAKFADFVIDSNGDIVKQRYRLENFLDNITVHVEDMKPITLETFAIKNKLSLQITMTADGWECAFSQMACYGDGGESVGIVGFGKSTNEAMAHYVSQIAGKTLRHMFNSARKDIIVPIGLVV